MDKLIGQKFGRLTVSEYIGPDKFRLKTYKCNCECGNICVTTGNRLRSKVTTSCGCYHKQQVSISGKLRKKEKSSSGLNALFRIYKNGAERRNLEFLISKDEFNTLTKLNCYYCNCAPNQKLIPNKSSISKEAAEHSCYVYNGLDRLNNSLGYFKENLVSCCGTCNRAKDVMSSEEFFNWIVRVYKNVSK